MGTVFAAVQLYEWHTKPFQLGTSSYSSLYFRDHRFPHGPRAGRPARAAGDLSMGVRSTTSVRGAGCRCRQGSCTGISSIWCGCSSSRPTTSPLTWDSRDESADTACSQPGRICVGRFPVVPPSACLVVRWRGLRSSSRLRACKRALLPSSAAPGRPSGGVELDPRRHRPHVAAVCTSWRWQPFGSHGSICAAPARMGHLPAACTSLLCGAWYSAAGSASQPS